MTFSDLSQKAMMTKGAHVLVIDDDAVEVLTRSS